MVNDDDVFLSYVGKNKIIPEKLLAIQSASDYTLKQTQLLRALQTQDFNHACFDSPDCYLRTQLLYEQDAINENQRLTVFIFLMALATHTNRQPLKAEDSDVKQIQQVEFIGPQHPDYRRYLSGYLDKLNQTQALQHLSPEQASSFEYGMIAIELPSGHVDNPTHQGMNVEVRNYLNHIFIFQKLPDRNAFVIPAIGLFNSHLHRNNPELVYHLLPTLGSISVRTLYERHRRLDQHPVNIYSADIQSNPKTVHNIRMGPLLTAMHDMIHAYLHNREYSQKSYHFYRDEMIPFMFRLYDMMNQNPNIFKDDLALALFDIIAMMNDFVVQDTNYYSIIKVQSIFKEWNQPLASFLLQVPLTCSKAHIESTYDFDLPVTTYQDDGKEGKITNHLTTYSLNDWTTERLQALLEWYCNPSQQLYSRITKQDQTSEVGMDKLSPAITPMFEVMSISQESAPTPGTTMDKRKFVALQNR